MTRIILALVAVFFLLDTSRVAAEELSIPEVTLSGDDLPSEIRLAPPDADAFRRRINRPPRLEETPSVSGPSFEVTSDYWEDAVRREEEGEDEMEVDPTATYYPEDGYIHAVLGDTDVWMVIDLRQRAILDRNIRLAHAGEIGANPSSVNVIGAALQTEVIGVEAGGHRVEMETAREIFAALSAANPEPFVEPRTPVVTGGGFWIIVTLPEGRAIQYYYDGTHIHESLGTERYDAADVADLLDGFAPEEPFLIEQQEPVGSLLWWPATLGGGLLLVALAVWFRRRTLTT